MSSNSDQLAEKIKTMDKDEAVEIILSILSTSKNVELKIKAADFLTQYDEIGNDNFQNIKIVFIKDHHPQLRLKLIDILTIYYQDDGINFLKEQYKNCKDGSVRTKLIEIVGELKLNKSIPFLIDALNDSNIETKKKAIVLLGKTESNEALRPLLNIFHFRNTEIYNSLIDTIVKIGNKGNLQIINDFINTEDLYIKREIPLILGKIKKKESENVLLNLLKDNNMQYYFSSKGY